MCLVMVFMLLLLFLGSTIRPQKTSRPVYLQRKTGRREVLKCTAGYRAGLISLGASDRLEVRTLGGRARFLGGHAVGTDLDKTVDPIASSVKWVSIGFLSVPFLLG
jgi:hypothetical protein